MARRVDYARHSPQLVKALVQLSSALKTGSIEQSILDLVAIRASQLNGCAICLALNLKQAKMHGESDVRLRDLAGWRESKSFTVRERAALAWTEALTQLPALGVPDKLYESVRTELSEKEVSDLTFQITSVNAWNRINVGLKPVLEPVDAELGISNLQFH
jgi:AhpD family alkylhydroperoxidase